MAQEVGAMSAVSAAELAVGEGMAVEGGALVVHPRRKGAGGAGQGVKGSVGK